MLIPYYLGIVRSGEEQLAEAFKVVSDRHYNDYEIREMCKQFAGWSSGHSAALQPIVDRYGVEQPPDPEQLRSSLFHGARAGAVGLLHDLQDLSLLTNAVRTNWTILNQAAIANHDRDLEALYSSLGDQTNRQISWLCGQIKNVSPQAVLVPADLPSETKASLPKEPSVSAFPGQVWAPLAAGGLTLLVGLASLAFGRAWLFPSLGPTAYLQAENPAHPSSRFYNTVLGHLVGLGAGFLGVLLFNAWSDPATLQSGQLTLGRLGAAVVALILTVSVTLLLKASHPPAAATTLLVALGSVKTLDDALNLAIGAILIAVLGELARRVRLGQSWLGEVEARVPTNAGR